MTTFMCAFIFIHCFWYRAVPVHLNRKSALKLKKLICPQSMSSRNMSEEIQTASADEWAKQTELSHLLIKCSTTSPQTVQPRLKSWIRTFSLDNVTFYMGPCCHVQLLYRDTVTQKYKSASIGNNCFLLHEVYKVRVFVVIAIMPETY